ncbi:MAG TPA: amidohydrolase family protein [Planctomycetota bacterium]|nr:amidohydrolase family protein [Planctomycetota bacterium]
MGSLVVAGGLLVPMSGAPPFVGDLWIRDGEIAAVGRAPVDAAGERIDASGCFVLPGLVQGHLHLVQTLFRGEAEELTLLEWLRRRVWPLEAAHDEASLRAAARSGIAECVAAGVTAVLDMGTTHGHEAVLEELARSGIRGWSGKAMMDLDPDGDAPRRLRETTAGSLDESEALARRCRGRIGYAYAPRFALSATPDLHREVARRAREHGRRVHTHAAETRAEVEAVRERTGLTAIRFLETAGLDGAWTLAHGVHVDAGEIDVLRRGKAGVAHCPTSNLKLGSGIANVPALRRAGVPVALGSDGAPCNNRLDPFREMSLAACLPRRDGDAAALTARDVLALATIDGARAIGLDRVCGSLEVGKRGDAVVLDPRLPSTQPARDPYATVVHAASPENVRDVFCDGDALKRDFRATRFDPREVAAHAGEQAERLRERARL